MASIPSVQRKVQDGSGRIDLDARFLRNVVDQLPVTVAYWDADLRNRLSSGAYVRWRGISAEQLRGMHIRDVLGAELFEESRPYIDGVLAGEEQVFGRTITDHDGRRRHMQVCYVPDVVGKRVEGFMVLVTDVTARAEVEDQLRRSNEQYRALARCVPRSFAHVFDADLRFILADGPGLGAFSLTPAEMEGSTLHEALPRHADQFEARYRAVIRGETARWDADVDGRVFALTAGPVLDDDGLVFAGLVIGTEVTAERRRQASHRALRDVAVAAAAGVSAERVLGLVSDALIEVFDADFGRVSRVDEQGRTRVVSAGRELHAGPGDPEDPGTDEMSSASAALPGGQPIVIRYDEHSTGAGRLFFDAGIGLTAAAPITVNGRMSGAVGFGLVLGKELFESDAEVLERLGDFADVAASSISSAEAWEALTSLSTTDPLTALPNRRLFDEHLDRALATAARDGAALSVAILDIDRFKAINDTFGHPAGDRVLREGARRMAAIARGGETLARIGGEEFGLIFPATDTKGALRAAERFRSVIAEQPIDGHSVTASVGICTSRNGAGDAERLLAGADRALYDAKDAGRDCVRTHVEVQL